MQLSQRRTGDAVEAGLEVGDEFGGTRPGAGAVQRRRVEATSSATGAQRVDGPQHVGAAADRAVLSAHASAVPHPSEHRRPYHDQLTSSSSCRSRRALRVEILSLAVLGHDPRPRRPRRCRRRCHVRLRRCGLCCRCFLRACTRHTSEIRRSLS